MIFAVRAIMVSLAFFALLYTFLSLILVLAWPNGAGSSTSVCRRMVCSCYEWRPSACLPQFHCS